MRSRIAYAKDAFLLTAKRFTYPADSSIGLSLKLASRAVKEPPKTVRTGPRAS